VSSTPLWVTVGLAFASAVLGVGLRATWEELRDFRAARRIVVSELRGCERALRAAQYQTSGHRDVLSDTAYRTASMVLARYLPDPLWNDLEDIYSLFTARAKDDPATLVSGQALARALLERIGAAAPALSAARIWHGLPPWSWRRRVRG
jgi:hypothetical protein